MEFLAEIVTLEFFTLAIILLLVALWKIIFALILAYKNDDKTL